MLGLISELKIICKKKKEKTEKSGSESKTTEKFSRCT